MRSIKQINIENHPYYFFNYLINIKNFDPNLLDIDKISVNVLMLLFTILDISQWKVLTI